MKNISKSFSEEDVEHIAWLARIELSKEEKELFASQLSTILEYFHIIDEIDTEGVQPTLHVLNLANVSREDVVEESLPREEAMANASIKEKGYFRSPKTM